MSRLILSIVLVSTTTLLAQNRDFSKVEIKGEQLAPSIHMLMGAGGNLGVSHGEDGVFLIDDQYAPLVPKIQAAIGEISKQPIRFVINTHWHGDHTGGNEALGGTGAVIVAHNNVRRRMSAEQFNEFFDHRTAAAPKGALPVVTFADGVTFHLNGETIEVIHLPRAHTDGDAAVMFKKANVLHTGDLFFNGLFPFIDSSTGGSIDGMIAAADRLLKMTNSETKIIPGHGPLANAADYRVFRQMLVTVRDRIKKEIASGKSADAVVKAAPLADLEEKWGKGFLNTEAFTRLMYSQLKSKPKVKSKK